MAGLNKTMIIGNLGKDPEMRFTAAGQPTTTFSVAVNTRHINESDQQVQETEWFNVVAWGKLAETCNQYLSKGRMVYVEGSMRTHSWEAQDGQRHYRMELVARTVLFLSAREKEGNEENEPGADDIPF